MIIKKIELHDDFYAEMVTLYESDKEAFDKITAVLHEIGNDTDQLASLSQDHYFHTGNNEALNYDIRQIQELLLQHGKIAFRLKMHEISKYRIFYYPDFKNAQFMILALKKRDGKTYDSDFIKTLLYKMREND